jgi:hypothetical protein
MSDTNIEKCYTIAELALLLHMSLERTRQLVMAEPGVLVFSQHQASKDRGGERRTRNMYRVPASVVERILRRCANPMAA